MTGGMAIAILDAPEEWPEIPQAYLNGNGIEGSQYGGWRPRSMKGDEGCCLEQDDCGEEAYCE